MLLNPTGTSSFPKNIPGISARDVGGLCLCGLLFATLSRLVRAKADTARLMRGKTTFLYWGVPNIRRVEVPKGKSRKVVVPQSEIPYLGRF